MNIIKDDNPVLIENRKKDNILFNEVYDFLSKSDKFKIEYCEKDNFIFFTYNEVKFSFVYEKGSDTIFTVLALFKVKDINEYGIDKVFRSLNETNENIKISKGFFSKDDDNKTISVLFQNLIYDYSLIKRVLYSACQSIEFFMFNFHKELNEKFDKND